MDDTNRCLQPKDIPIQLLNTMFTKEELLSKMAAGYAQQYFADMRFTSNMYEPSIINSFLTIEKNGKEIIDSSPGFDIQDFSFRVSKLDEGIEVSVTRRRR